MTKREFVLHDGEDEDKTEKLHEFMGTIDWEGDTTGVTIHSVIGVRPGDTIVIEDNGDEEPVVSVRRAVQ